MLWSIAVYDFSLSSEEFYALTPRQFHSLSTRFKDMNERAEFLMGISTAAQVNHSFNTPKKAFTPVDFMPSKQHEKEKSKPKSKRFNRQKFAQEIRSALAMLPPGRVVYNDPQAGPKAPAALEGDKACP